MAQLMEYAEYLSKEIGPRPAGTEEEQQAALYITEQFQKDSGFKAQIEEFTSSSNVEILSAVPGLVVIVVAILSMIFPMLSIPAFILAAAAAALYTLEAFGHPIVTRALARGASQNVVAKYQPNADAEKPARSRKIILVAHYDSGKVTPGLVRAVESIKLPVSIGFICVCGIVLAAFFLLLHIFVNAGIGAIVLNVLIVLMLVICAYPVIRTILNRTAPYNEGANNNATGAAALIEVARRISRGSVSEADLAASPDAYGISIHGEEAARESGLIPEGAQIRYEAERLVPPSELGEYDEEERLLAAKAAIAAMTGQPVERHVYGSVASNLVNSRAHGDAPSFETQVEADLSAGVETQSAVVQAESPIASVATSKPVATAVAPSVAGQATSPAEVEGEADGYKNAPSWFVAAQQNAKKPTGETGPIQRSRYAEAIEAVEREAAEREREREEQERLQREAELKAREQAARAAIEQSVQASKDPEPEPVPAAKPVEAPEFEPLVTPVFTPYQEAHVIDVPAIGDKPADDAFAASLGNTTAFDPRQLRAVDAEQDSAADARPTDRRLADLPSITEPVATPQPAAPEEPSPSRSGMFRKLRTDVPSMSGVLRMQEAGEDVSQKPVQPSVREQAPEAKSAPVPVQVPAQPDETVRMDYASPRGARDSAEGYDNGKTYDKREAYHDPNELSENDRHDDGQGQVDMPTSRAGGFFSRFRRKDRENLSETPQEWLDVDEDFDARTVGRERGSWESFRDGAQDDADETSRRQWEGGAYSRVRLGRVDTRSGSEVEADLPEEDSAVEEQEAIVSEVESIYHFRNPLYNTEVWFVALGSDNVMHDGAKAFLTEHADELRGSMIIEIESLGAGELSVASAEGRMRPVVASSRIKRYTRAATAATGIAPGSVDLSGTDSAASIMQAAGYQTMHLMGVENGGPALKGSPDDILENVDDLLFDDNVNFIMELLKK